MALLAGPYTSFDLNTLLRNTAGARQDVTLSLRDDLVGETSRIAGGWVVDGRGAGACVGQVWAEARRHTATNSVTLSSPHARRLHWPTCWLPQWQRPSCSRCSLRAWRAAPSPLSASPAMARGETPPSGRRCSPACRVGCWHGTDLHIHVCLLYRENCTLPVFLRCDYAAIHAELHFAEL